MSLLVQKTASAPGAFLPFAYTATADFVLHGCHGQLIASATVGNRQLALSVLDGADVLFRSAQSTVVTASNTRFFNFGPGLPSGEIAPVIQEPVQPVVVRSGWIIRLEDLNNVDAAADTLNAALVLER